MKSVKKLQSMINKAKKNNSRSSKLCLKNGSLLVVDFYLTTDIPSFSLIDSSGSETELFSESEVIDVLKSHYLDEQHK